MLRETISDSGAWRASSAGDASAWVDRLPGEVLSALEEVTRGALRRSEPLTQIRLNQVMLNVVRDLADATRTALDAGRGFVVLDRLPLEHLSEHEARAMYWLLGQALGEPSQQNIEGILLYNVLDTGRDVTEGARFSVTNAESSFHTDNSFGTEVPDYVGLLCLHTAKAGGRSQLVSGYALHNTLLERDRSALGLLYEPFYFDRRGQFFEGESPFSRFPVFDWNNRELTPRYLQLYIEVGHQKGGEPLTAEKKAALEALKDLAESKSYQIEFDLEPGQILFTNNRWILHNRTAFEDHNASDRKRHYVRLWLNRSENRPGVSQGA